MSICVAVGNKVMDTRLPQPAGCGDKYDVSGLDFGRLFSAFYTFFKYTSPDAKASPSPSRGEGLHRPWCHKILGTWPSMTGGRSAAFVRLLRCARNDAERTNIVLKGLDVVCQYAALLERRVQRGTRARKALVVTRQANPLGRSMIEMLGVLAIIGVLSVGGIAGYSKAMEKWKINKTIGEYSMLIYGLLEHVDDIKKNTAGGYNNDDLTGLAKALNLIPNSWHIKNNVQALDNMGNLVQIYANIQANLLTIDFYLGGVTYTDEGNYSANFSEKLCTEIYNNIAIPLHSAVERVSLWQPVSDAVVFDGDKNCTSARPCLSNLKLDEIHRACSACNKSKEICSVTLFF